MVNNQLPLHEWCIILLFCSILLVLAAFALKSPTKQISTSSTIKPNAEFYVAVLQVKIDGQVAKPGSYRFPMNATLKQLLEKAQPLSSADLSQLNGRRKLRDRQIIHVPERHSMTIRIAGAVQQPGSLQILSGTRYCELVDQLQVLPDADLQAIRKKKRFLQEGDVVEIPIKKSKKKII